ncbi:MAG TPA: hypothetical protein VFW76_10185 [Ktedonobacterales bacterium]|nr:hypothetical protein [Ktedonobacterales bacterium]
MRPGSSTPNMADMAELASQRNARRASAGYAFARVLWVAVALLTVSVFVISLPAYAAQMRTLCPTLSCANGQLTAAQAEALVRLGFSLATYANAFVALNIISSACWFLLALLLLWRGGNDRMALFTAFTLLLFGVARFPDAPAALAALHPAWWLPVMGLRYLGSACLSFFCYLFPDGRFVPWWTRWVAFAWLLPQLPEFFAPGSWPDPLRYPPLLQAVGFLGFVLSVVVAQVYRYRRVSTPVQRQQTKWVVFGLAIALSGFLALTFLTPLLFPTTQPLSFSVPAFLAASYGVMLLVPVSLAIAILRRQLYDIDLLINRTLVYGSLTAILTGVYFLGVVGVQALIQAVTGVQKASPLAIVASTLVVAALFQPLRRRLQRGIDRRFYRRRYDTARTLERLAATLRQEVDLQTLTDQLLHVVKDTMQPAHLSLWLRPTEQRNERQVR